MRCAVLDDYQRVALSSADWRPLDTRVEIDVLSERLPNEPAVVAALQDYDIIVLMRERTPFPRSVIEKLPRLRLLVTTGMRNSAVDLAAAGDHGVLVSGTASRSEAPVELTWALILGLARNVLTEVAAMRNGGAWQSTVGTDLAGATLGLVGLGRTGSRVAAVAQAFGMDVVAWSEHLSADRAAAAGARLAESLPDLLACSDFVSIHLVLGPRTRRLIDEAALRHMRPSAFLINTSRADIVDEAALLRAVESGQLAGAGVDVYSIEPVPHDHPWRHTTANVLTTPHLGYVTRTNYAQYFREIVEDITAFVDGAPVRLLAR